jgi:adenylate kinase family enzyme
MQAQPFPYQRIIVIGTTGSGKSTLAEQLSQQLGFEYIELDALYWLPEWQHRSEPEFRACVEAATSAPAWVMAGNYSAARDISWPRAELIIWLDYSLWTIFWRLWRRTWRRWWTQELLWGTNHERLWQQFKIWSPDDSLFNWLFATYWERKRKYPLLLALPEYAHLKVIHMHTPMETEAWLKGATVETGATHFSH